LKRKQIEQGGVDGAAMLMSVDKRSNQKHHRSIDY
jgi:hypothetical protein